MPKIRWAKEQVRAVLDDQQWFKTEEVSPNGTIKFALTDDAIVNWAPTTGSVWVQGKLSETHTNAMAIFAKPFSEYAFVPKDKVFVIYGHDEEAKAQLKGLIEEFGLEPIVLDEIPGQGKTIIEQLEKQLANADFACTLLTPDDEGHKSGQPDAVKPRARQNVIFELGMAVGRLGREKVAVLLKPDTEVFSDIHGLIYIEFVDDGIAEAKKKLAGHLKEAGVKIRTAPDA